MQMSSGEALTLIGSIAMRSMGILILMAESMPKTKEARAYIMRQREWYERKQDEIGIAEQVDELMGGDNE